MSEWRSVREVRFGATPKPARDTRALPLTFVVNIRSLTWVEHTRRMRHSIIHARRTKSSQGISRVHESPLTDLRSQGRGGGEGRSLGVTWGRTVGVPGGTVKA